MKFLKRLLIPIIVLFLLIIFAVFLLEKTSQLYRCQPAKTPPWPSCGINPTGEEGRALLEKIRVRQQTREHISKGEYRLAFEKLIIETDPELMGPLNGLSCGSFGLVKNNLPSQSKLFVKRHELEHLLQEERIIIFRERSNTTNNEFLANLAATKEYPWGLIETVFVSLKERSKYYDSTSCYLISLWKTFKVYFLPF